MNQQPSPEKRPISSVILKPRIARLPLDLSNEPKKVNKNHMQPFLILANGEHAYQTNFAGKVGKDIGWTDLITFIAIQAEQIFIRCADYNDGKEELNLGEGTLDIIDFLKNPPKGPVNSTCSLYKDQKKLVKSISKWSSYKIISLTLSELMILSHSRKAKSYIAKSNI